MAEFWAAMMPYRNFHLCSWIFLMRLSKGPGSYESLKQFIHKILGSHKKILWTFKKGLKMVDFFCVLYSFLPYPWLHFPGVDLLWYNVFTKRKKGTVQKPPKTPSLFPDMT